MINTVIRNLLHNAVKFSFENGKIEIVLSNDGKFVKTCIIDSGIGLSEDEINKLFLLDQPIKKLGTNNEKGTGLGLIICKEFIEKNNGTLTVSGEKNKGCTFCIMLPAKNTTQQA
jgi:signal transduction histidine kinase